MDDRNGSNSPDTACARCGFEPEPRVKVPRDAPAADAPRRSLDDVEQWQDEPLNPREAATRCFCGPELDEGMAVAFRIMGIELPLP